MNSVLNLNQFFVKEHTGIFKAANNFDIFHPETKELLLNCREEHLGFFTKLLRFTDYKKLTPFNVVIKTPEGENLLTVKRGISFFRSKVEVLDENNIVIGKFKQQFFSIGGKFKVLDENDKELCMLKGKWTSWDFKFVRDTTEFAHVTKKWGGIGKELFTSADNYMLSIDENVPQDSKLRLLIIGAVMCIDMVLKE